MVDDATGAGRIGRLDQRVLRAPNRQPVDDFAKSKWPNRHRRHVSTPDDVAQGHQQPLGQLPPVCRRLVFPPGTAVSISVTPLCRKADIRPRKPIERLQRGRSDGHNGNGDRRLAEEQWCAHGRCAPHHACRKPDAPQQRRGETRRTAGNRPYHQPTCDSESSATIISRRVAVLDEAKRRCSRPWRGVDSRATQAEPQNVGHRQ